MLHEIKKKLNRVKYRIVFTLLVQFIVKKITTYAKEQKNVTHNPDKNKSIETSFERAQT